ncbi:MAG: hypothetical protein JSW27_25700 [Phycisphaerales bacterium]|nr:MAG: hypothetical protein JSW27_25700 [Phycisphaerales bacterium]
MQIDRHIQKRCKLTQGQENALFGALLLVGLLAAYAWVLSPHLAFLRASHQYGRAMHMRLNASETVNDDLACQRETLQTLRAERAAFSDLAFSAEGAKKFHNDLQTWCGEAGLDVMSLGYGNDESLAAYGARQASSAMVFRSATMTLHGAYGGMVALLETLQSRPQKIWVAGFQMTTLPSKPGWLACDMTVSICVDYEKENE